MDDHSRDWILINDLSVRAAVGQSHWIKPQAESKPQPLLISVAVPHSLRLAASSDHLPYSVHYGTLCKSIETLCEGGKRNRVYACVEELAEEIARTAFETFVGIHEIRVKVSKTRALLHARSASVAIVRRRGDVGGLLDSLAVEDLQLSTIIGIHPWERESKQVVKINLVLDVPSWTLDVLPGGFDYLGVVQRVSDHGLESSYQTVEALISAIAHHALLASSASGVKRVTARVGKPNALMYASSPEVQVTRTLEDLQELDTSNVTSLAQPSSEEKRCVIAFGSNVGDRFLNIEKALQALEKPQDGNATRVVATSFLYETDAMYVEDQARFINGACVVTTSLKPHDLLVRLKEIEAEVGRTPTFRNGPRVVDLDIIFYGDIVYDSRSSDEPTASTELIIPHERVHEREFVLRPLKDIIPNFVHPKLNLQIHQLLTNIMKSSSPSAPPMRRVVPFHKRASYWTWGLKTYIMAVINTTPDSFSDGGDHLAVASALQFATAASKYADILDVGGYSTRPGAQPINEQEEIARAVPIIKAIREAGITLPISIDTFRAGVAETAIEAGADCINDVYGFTGESDDRILEVAKRLGVPVILMHSRGDAGQSQGYEAQGGVIPGIREELGAKMKRALQYGIRRWNLIADPGLGFSKSPADNLAVLKDLKSFTAPVLALGEPTRSIAKALEVVHPLSALPVLAGASRKSFLGKVVDRETTPKERLVASAAAHTAAIQQGCDIIRAHDVAETWDMVKVADGIWRS